MSKSKSLLWVLFAYIACLTAAITYLFHFADPANGLLLNSFIADLIATVVIFAFSRAFRNSSFYDAYWSVIPPLFLLYWWYSREVDTVYLRYIFVSIVVWFWAIRLTWNWSKHWTGMTHEDWRYPIIKEKSGSLEFFADFAGIHLFPTLQVFAGMLPMYAAVALGTEEVGVLDYVALLLGVSAASLQLVSDRQLHQFIANNSSKQIIDTGLWAWCRHPNYLGELMFWGSLALFGLAAYPEGWWWQVIGFTAMLVMFRFASIPLMETRSLERRPGYQAVMNTIPMLWPRRPK